MKSLDEAIEILEKVVNHDYVWFDEKTALMTIETLTDILQHLREYQWQMTNPDGDHQQLEKAQKLLWEFYQNEPLTWQELKGLEGKPVFVEERYRNGDLKSSGWCLIDFWNDDQICLRDQGGNPWSEHRSNYGRDWQAYRKERE